MRRARVVVARVLPATRARQSSSAYRFSSKQFFHAWNNLLSLVAFSCCDNDFCVSCLWLYGHVRPNLRSAGGPGARFNWLRVFYFVSMLLLLVAEGFIDFKGAQAAGTAAMRGPCL